jgi:hypothetical protein
MDLWMNGLVVTVFPQTLFNAEWRPAFVALRRGKLRNVEWIGLAFASRECKLGNMNPSSQPPSNRGDAAPTGEQASWKSRIRKEMIAYWVTVAYLTLYFGVFFNYRRLLLAQYQISYENYGIALIQALVLAKVILIGDLLRLGRGLEDRPLIYPTLFRAFIFTIWVALFKLLEETVKGLYHGEGLGGGFDRIVAKGQYEYFASCLVVFFTFIPFFAFKELVRVTGKGKIFKLFFRRRVPEDSNLNEDSG